jgi:hypothetical protein
VDLEERDRRIGDVRRAVLLLALVLVPSATAGGSQVDLVVRGGSVFVVDDAGFRELGAATGQTAWAPTPVDARYDESVDVVDGAIWIASLTNGSATGEIDRIDLRTHASRVVLRVKDGAPLYVTHGGGGIYAYLARGRRTGVVRLATSGAVTGRWRISDAGRMAADASGCWITADGRLLHIDPRGRLHVAARVPFGDVTTGGGAVWIGLRDELVRVDERTGDVHTFSTTRLDLGGFQHDLAVGDGYLWTLGTGALERRDLRTGHLLQAVRIPRIADAVAVTPTAVWVGTTQRILRLDPRTLKTTLRVDVL